MNKTDIQIDKQLSFYVIFFFIIQTLNGSIKTILPFLTRGLQSNISLMSGALLLVVMVKNLKYVYRRSGKVFLIAYYIFLLLYAISLAQNMMRGDPVDLLIKDSASWTFIWWIPMGLFVYSVQDKDILYKILLKGSYFISIIVLLSVFPIIVLENILLYGKEYNMFFSYMLIFPLILHINEYFKTKKISLLIIGIVELSVLILYGSRGVLLCVLSFFILKIAYGQIPFSKKVVAVIFFTFTLVLFIKFSEPLLQVLHDFNLSSRTLEKLATHQMESGRNYVWESGIELIKERPLLGYGLGGEFYQMTYEASKLLGTGIPPKISDLTPHNGFLQLMLNFGVIFGLLIGIFIVSSILIVKKIIFSSYKDLLIITYSVFIIPAMTVGDGIFVKPGIAIYVFLLLSYNRYKLSYEKP